MAAEVQRMISSVNHFEVLNVPVQLPVDVAVLKTQFKKLAKVVHPDKCQHPQANEAFRLLTDAFECLSDPRKLFEYVQKTNAIPTKEPENKNKRKWSINVEDVERAFMENLSQKRRKEEEKKQAQKEEQLKKDEAFREELKQTLFAESFMESFKQHHCAWKKWQDKAKKAAAARPRPRTFFGSKCPDNVAQFATNCASFTNTYKDSSSAFNKTNISTTTQSSENSKENSTTPTETTTDKSGESTATQDGTNYCSDEEEADDGNVSGKKVVCYVCLRTFGSHEKLRRHQLYSKTHKLNTLELQRKAFS